MPWRQIEGRARASSPSAAFRESLRSAADRCGVHERTLRRWLAEPQFQEEYHAARRTIFDVGINRVQALTAKAVDTLEMLLDAKKHPSVRLGAARTITEIGIHERDAETILRKLDEVETAMRRQGGKS